MTMTCTVGRKLLIKKMPSNAVAAMAAHLERKKAAKAVGQQFDYPVSLVGTSTWLGTDGKPVNIYYDPATGTNGQAVAQDVSSKINDLMTYCDTVFGVRGSGGNVIIAALPDQNNVPQTDGSTGAYHYSCDFSSGGDWYEDVAFGNSVLTFGLVMAEINESYMGLQARGWNCGGSGGEALSRIMAEIVSGGISGTMADFSARSSWDGSNWIDSDQGTDQDYPSIACGMLYLDWMRSLGFTIQRIVQAGGTTLTTNYRLLTGKDTAWADFSTAVKKVSIGSANPFGIQDSPYPLGPSPSPNPTPTPTPNPTPTPTPVPVPSTLLQLIDEAFAWAEEAWGAYPSLVMAMEYVRGLIDQWLANNPLPVWNDHRKILKQIFADLMAGSSSRYERMMLWVTESIVSRYMKKIGK